MATPNPELAVVICHGSYHTPEPYQPFMAALREAGIDAFCPQLPTSDLSLMNVGDMADPDFTRDAPPQGYPTASDDLEVVSRLLERLIIKESRNIVLLGHSSGGWVATQAAIPALQAKARIAEERRGGVVCIFFAAGFAIPVGESVHSFFQPKDGSDPIMPPYCRYYKPNFEGVASAVDGDIYFLNGLPEAEAKRYAASLTASPKHDVTLTNDPYAELPIAYLVTEDDRAMPSAYQEMLVSLIKQRPGIRLDEYRCPSGHSPHLTWTAGLVATIQEFGQKCCDQEERSRHW